MLPLGYPLRNLWRLKGRTALTIAGFALTTLLVVLMAGFARGLAETAEGALSGDVIYLVGTTGEHDMVRSAIPRGAAEAAAASLPGAKRVGEQRCVSVEIHSATRRGNDVGLLRGVTPAAFLVHDRVTLIEGREPTGPYELLAGRLAHVRLGQDAADLAVGKTITLENRPWTIVGRFAAPGTVIEAELWGRLDDVLLANNRVDVSCVVARLESPKKIPAVRLWAARNATAFEVSLVEEKELYATLERTLSPITGLLWVMALLVLLGGSFACANAMFAAVLARTKELGTLRSLGFGSISIVLALLAEAVLVAALGGLIGFALAGRFDAIPVRFPMGAFFLDLSPGVRMLGLAAALGAGVVGGLLPALRAVRMSLPEALGGRV
ncbi:MAG: ABC transporter permease [Planctomycetota bacterium]|nr:ABC transporter permease [Planctomycetota bacterium]MCB9902413.1 ABC transporter permease [Planctomycetota bacterium]